MSKILLLLSGGIDSMAALDILRRSGRDVEALFVNYGQAASQAEQRASASVASRFGIKLRTQTVKFPDRFGAGEIPNRNGFLIFLAGVLAGDGVEAIAVGVHAGVPYPDCSAEFLDRIESALVVSSGGKTGLIAPLRTWQKQEIIAYAVEKNLPIAITHSCESADLPCGECSSCHDRRELQC